MLALFQIIFLIVVSIFFVKLRWLTVNEIEEIPDIEAIRRRERPALTRNCKRKERSKVWVIPQRSFIESNAYGIDHDLSVERKTTPFSDFLLDTPVFGREGEIWGRHHLLLKSCFGKSQGNAVITSAFKNLSTGIERKIKRGEEVNNIQALISETVFSIMGRFLIGAEVKDCGSAEEFYLLYMTMLRHLCNRSFSDEILRIRKLTSALHPYKNRAIEDRKRLFSFIDRIVKYRQESLSSMGESVRDAQMDVLSRLVVKSNNSGKGKEEIAEDLFGILFAGHDTATASIKYLLLELCKDKRLQTKVRQEIITHMGELEGFEAVNIKELSRTMPLLTASIYETWRTMPPPSGSLIRKVTDEDGITHLGTAMPRDSMIMQNFLTSERNYETWGNDADQFNPNRFLIKTGKDSLISIMKVERLATFGFGRHGRLGNICASHIVIIGLIMLLNEFEFDLPVPFDGQSDIAIKFA